MGRQGHERRSPGGLTCHRTTRRRAYWLCGAAFAASAAFLLVNLGAYPIVLWDESRVAVNALEMLLTGPSLVTTYQFQPDLWNTKPPLLIWLMTGSMALFGPSEWAIRLPSALAALATAAVIMLFVWRLTRSPAATCLACVLLVASRGFYGRHAAATGDYDALLTLLTTSYLCILFFAIHRRAPPALRLLSAGVLMAAAILTKGVAGLIPGLGAVLYLAFAGRWTRPFLTPWYLAAAGIVVSASAAFYGLREIAAPGYVQAVVQNELAGRYASTIGGHREPVWYFARLIVESTFSAGPLLLLVPPGAAAALGRIRLGIIFASCAGCAIVLVYSASATKLAWYVVPAYPFLAIALALSAAALARRLEARGDRIRTARLIRPSAEALMLALSAAIVAAAAYRYDPVSRQAGGPRAHYGLVFADLYQRGIHTVSVVERGDRNAEGFAHYAPRLRFYQLLWQTRSFNVREVAPDAAALTISPGDVLVTCDSGQVDDVRHRGEVVAAVAGCIAVRR